MARLSFPLAIAISTVSSISTVSIMTTTVMAWLCLSFAIAITTPVSAISTIAAISPVSAIAAVSVVVARGCLPLAIVTVPAIAVAVVLHLVAMVVFVGRGETNYGQSQDHQKLHHWSARLSKLQCPH